MIEFTRYVEYRNTLNEASFNDRPFIATKADVEHWFQVLNVTIFHGRITPFRRIIVKQLKDEYAYVLYREGYNKQPVLYVHPRWKNKRLFVEIIAHEMIHKLQYQEGKPVRHDDFFWRWASNLHMKGLTLHKELEDHEAQE